MKEHNIKLLKGFFLGLLLIASVLPSISQEVRKIVVAPIHVEIADTSPKGADFGKPISMARNLKKDAQLILDDIEGNKIIDLYNNELYLDKNKYARIAYYFPGSINLTYDWVNGKYGMRILNGTDGDANLAINFEMESSIKNFEKRILKHILCKYHNKCDYELKPVELNGSVEIETGLQMFSVEEGDALQSTFQGFDNTIDLAFSMTENNMKMMLTSYADELSIEGNLSLGNRHSVIQAGLQDSRTLGNIYYEDEGKLKYYGFKNTSPYPINILQVILLNEDTKKEIIKSKFNVNEVIEPESSWKVSSEVGNAIYYDPVDVVLRYEVLPCEECETKAIMRINKTTNINTHYAITIYEAGACEYLENNFISVLFQDPQKEVVVKKGSYNDEVEVYKHPGSTIKYKYKIVLINQANGVRKTSRWITSDLPSIYLDEKAITDNFSEF